jgi:hypothetical protein
MKAALAQLFNRQGNPSISGVNSKFQMPNNKQIPITKTANSKLAAAHPVEI